MSSCHLLAAPPLPAHGPVPLLYVRFAGPPGLQATFYQGSAPGRTFAAPVTVGLRPGYLYRVKLTGLPQHPGASLCPTLEVRGTLRLPPRLAAADYPAPVVFSQEDIERALTGSFLTKVVFLEHPDTPLFPHSPGTQVNQPLELEVPAGRDPMATARAHGRPMLIVRFGGRETSPDELARESVPGTLLLPGEKGLPPPPAARPPWIPWAGIPVYDPVLGPRPPEEECLHDGGDAGLRAGIGPEGRLHGLDPADTVAEYADSHGRRRLAVSNRVCICVPRFAVTRTEITPAGYDTVTEIGGTQAVLGQAQIQTRLPSRQTHQNEQLEAMRGRRRASGSVVHQGLERLVRVEMLNAYEVDTGIGNVLGTAGFQRLTFEQRTRLSRQIDLARQLSRPYGTRGTDQVQAGPAAVGRVEGLDEVVTVQETRDLTVACNEEPRPPDKPLVLYKWTSAQAAQAGDVLTFFLKYSNHGGRPITDVAVSDSLTGRLEYLPGSARSDRDAVFTTQENAAGSVTLHWEISGRLLPGQSGVVRFQARVR